MGGAKVSPDIIRQLLEKYPGFAGEIANGVAPFEKPTEHTVPVPRVGGGFDQKVVSRHQQYVVGTYADKGAGSILVLEA